MHITHHIKNAKSKLLQGSLSQNSYYNILTNLIISTLDSHSVCIDVGCYRGSILDKLVRNSPSGIFFAFEPIPYLYHSLQTRYSKYSNVTIFDVALSNKNGFTEFQYVISNPPYSGIKKRKYKNPNEKVLQTVVKTRCLDDVIDLKLPIAFMKIDVEGGEYHVIKGGINTIKKHKPLIVFEHGLGAANYYDVTPDMMYDLLTWAGLRLALLDDWLISGTPLTKDAFCRQYYRELNYYFLAY